MDIAVDTNLMMERALKACEEHGLYAPLPATASWHDRKTWLQARQEGIGSSEVWALFSDDPDDRTNLYLSKIAEDPLANEFTVGTLPPDLERGRLFEPTAAMKYEELTGRELISLPLLRCKEEPLILTDVDRLIVPGTGNEDYKTRVLGMWEGKVPRWHVMSRYRKHGLPDRIIWQTQHHLAVTGAEFCSITIFNADSLSLLEWDLERNADMIAKIREEVPRFWAEHVEPRIPPESDEVPVDGFQVPGMEGAVRVRTDEAWEEASALYREADPLYREAKALREEAVGKLRALVGKEPGEWEGAGVRGILSTSAGRLKAGDTLDRIAEAWPLDSKKFKDMLKDGKLLDVTGEKLGIGDRNALSNELALDVYKLKVMGEPSLRFRPSVLRDED